MFKLGKFYLILLLIVFITSCSDDATAPIVKKEDLKTEIFDKWLVTTECIESYGGEAIGAKTNELWVFNKVPNTTEEAYFTVKLSRTKAIWTKSDLYDFPHWLISLSGYDEANKVYVALTYDIIELSPMKGVICFYFYSNDAKAWILLSKYSIIGNRQFVGLD